MAAQIFKTFYFVVFITVFALSVLPPVTANDVAGDQGQKICGGVAPSSCPVKCFRTDPVCGVDGVTYWCGCSEAACAGVQVAKMGFCEVGNGGSVPLSGQALLLVHIVWLIVLGTIALEDLIFDSEIERIARHNKSSARRKRRERRQAEKPIDNKEHISTMTEQPMRKTLHNYFMPYPNNFQRSIMRPLIQTNNFEIKPALLQVIQHNQFGGAILEDPNSHMKDFLVICDTLKINGVSKDTIR
ncbi:hypothetical protein V8G54_007016 [Vigna mungo]|uniref:Kazal-like domain-containing protein n=1 Tax=Vigna mungo TaxID=3915 RepID=A0AAQ3P0X6_VIGMU